MSRCVSRSAPCWVLLQQAGEAAGLPIAPTSRDLTPISTLNYTHLSKPKGLHFLQLSAVFYFAWEDAWYEIAAAFRHKPEERHRKASTKPRPQQGR